MDNECAPIRLLHTFSPFPTSDLDSCRVRVPISWQRFLHSLAVTIGQKDADKNCSKSCLQASTASSS